jgi:hypothetical protein
VSVLGHKVYLREELTRTDYVWVTPYADRLGVKVGPMRTIGF